MTRGGDLLPGALRESLQAGAGTNAALGVLLDDFVRYHAVLVGLGGAVAAALLVLGGWCWRRSGRVNAGAGGAWTFERRVFVSFGGTGIVSGLLMAVIVAANVSTVLHPGPGFAALAGTLPHAQARTDRDRLQRAVRTWLESGQPDVPAVLRDRVEARLAWQRPKAALSGVCLVVLVLVGQQAWQALIARSRRRPGRWTFRERGLLVAGIGAVPGALLAAVMAVANTQASLAPLTLTLLYG